MKRCKKKRNALLSLRNNIFNPLSSMKPTKELTVLSKGLSYQSFGLGLHPFLLTFDRSVIYTKEYLQREGGGHEQDETVEAIIFASSHEEAGKLGEEVGDCLAATHEDFITRNFSHKKGEDVVEYCCAILVSVKKLENPAHGFFFSTASVRNSSNKKKK